MSYLADASEKPYLLMGNEAIARGALEAGVNVATGYPGTPSSEIIEALSTVSQEKNVYVEWSVNEKVALEVAAAASFAGLRALCAMKQNGVYVASDFLLHLAESGTRGGIVLVSCDDPGALSSANEGESRFFARYMEIPLLEPGNFQQAKEMTAWAFELSETLKSIVMIRSVTRLSHARGNVVFGTLPSPAVQAHFVHDGPFLDPDTGPATSFPVVHKHRLQQKKIEHARKIFDECPFNLYTGPETPDLLIVASSICTLYAQEAVHELNLQSRVGFLNLGTTWPLPSNVLVKYLSLTDKILIVEEVLPFLEEQVKVLAAEMASHIGVKTFYGKTDNTIPKAGELNPDIVIAALSRIFHLPYESASADNVKKIQISVPDRELTFCAGCPHRAAFWSIFTVLTQDGRQGFVCGDIGCYTLDLFPCGFSTLKTVHAMGSGIGMASGFGTLHQFSIDQPVLAVCGDSTFYHAAIPALINAIHHQSNLTLVVLDNSSTAMTGFQPHPGLPVDAVGNVAPVIDIEDICRSIGAKVQIKDPFNLKETQKTLKRMIQDKKTNVLILRQRCVLSPEKRGKKKYIMYVDPEKCSGEEGECNRACTQLFGCPGIVWDKESNKAKIDEVLCTGCGVCMSICPEKAIRAKKKG